MEPFGKYTLIRKIGAGGMAQVFLARTAVAQGLHKTLVIKKVQPAHARSQQFATMFVDEAKIALGLNHPNIVQVFDFGAVDDSYFLAMEYVEGNDLLRLLQDCASQRRRIPHGLSAHIAQQVAKGLDYAHRKTDEFGGNLGIVHRDVSPQNVLLSWDGAVKLVDFGIARARDVQEAPGVIKGKVSYMSPEQARGEPVDCRSDVFSVGIVLFEMVCARPLFPGKGKEALAQVKSGALPRPRDLTPDLPPSLEEIMLRALAFHREDRYQTARDLQHDLGRFQLQWAKDHGELMDSGALAQFLSTVVPDDQRVRVPRPVTEESPRSARTGPGSAIRDDGSSPHAAISAEPTPRGQDRKYVYVLEGLVRGVTALERRLQPTRAQRLLREFLGIARDIAFKHDAVLEAPRDWPDLAHPDKVSLRAIVGLPTASEDDGPRVIRLALALVDALDAVGSDLEPELRLSVGVQRGVALLAHRHERPHELEPATTGFAQRLAQQARGAEVLVGGRVFRAARREWNFENLPAIELPAAMLPHPADEDTSPGVRTARVYRLRSAKDRAQRAVDRAASTHVIVGRDLELKTLRDLYREVVVSGRKRQVLLLGDTGVGKRTLANALLASLPLGEAIVIRAATRVGAALTPYGVLADLARELLGLGDGADPAQCERRVVEVMPRLYPGEENPPEVRASVQTLTMLVSGRGQVTDLDPVERRQRLLQLLLRAESLLERGKPLIIVAEDIHWADQDSQDLFLAMLRSSSERPILAVTTSRRELRIERVAREVGSTVLHVDELSPEARAELLGARFAPDHDITALIEQIGRRAGGNPFFIGEILDALLEQRVITLDGSGDPHPGRLRWARRDVAVPVPSSLEDALVARFDRLPPSEKQVLLGAAILGRDFSAAEVTALLERPVRVDLEELARRDLLSTSEHGYRFKSDITMTVAYQMLPGELRNHLHRETARRITHHLEYRAGIDDAVVARHLELAGDRGAAAETYLRAASHAMNVGGNADAFRQLTRALRLIAEDDHARRFSTLAQRAEILCRLGKRPQQLRELHAMKKAAEELRSPRLLATAHAALAQFYVEVGKPAMASRAAAPALQYAREAGEPLAEADALRLAAVIAQRAGNNHESLRLAEEALALCTRVEHTASSDPSRPPPALLTQRALILNARGGTLWSLGQLERAIESYAEALVIYRSLALPGLEARALNNMGVVFNALGEFEDALAHYKSALKIDQRLGDRLGSALKLSNIGQCYSDLGDLDQGESYLNKALVLAEQSRDLSTTGDVLIALGRVQLVRRRPAEAVALLERGLAVATDNHERHQEIRALQWLALAQLEAGHPAEGALQRAQASTELAQAMPMPVGVIFGLCAQALAMSSLGRHPEAVAASQEALRLLDHEPRSEGREHVLRWHARVCDAAGRGTDAAVARQEAELEIHGKAERLRDPELRARLLAVATGGG
jgi:serine/threonine protein kinase/tetratricopeptide (TPR) repeat protein